MGAGAQQVGGTTQADRLREVVNDHPVGQDTADFIR
jgi:hypothetical protein